MYSKIIADPFPNDVEISFGNGETRQRLFYEKVTWEIDGTRLGLRYGENPDQPAALYRLVNGNLSIGEVTSLEPGRYLMSDVELLQSGKHPGKINITDVDNALGMLRYLTDKPAAVVVKHNNPAGAAIGDSISEAYHRALMTDRIAAFGSAVVCNRAIDRDTATEIANGYTEVVAAPEYQDGCFEILKKRKNLRIMRIRRIDRLAEYTHSRMIDYKSLIDGGLIVQWSFVPKQDVDSFVLATAKRGEEEVSIKRSPTESELADMMFGWLIESGVTSNSVLYVKDGVTLGIGTGEQDRVGVAEIAKLKATRNAADRICFNEYGIGWLDCSDPDRRSYVKEQLQKRPVLEGSTMISDAFFPMKDGVEVGLQSGVSSILQPGGAIRDAEIIDACNEHQATMLFTNQRSFRH